MGEQMQYGLLSAEEARTHPRRHILNRCLGRELIVGIDVLSTDVRPGDVLAQMSDGVHAFLPEAEILEILRAHPPEDACQTLVRRGRETGGEDNLSVQVVAILDCPPPSPRRWWRLGR